MYDTNIKIMEEKELSKFEHITNIVKEKISNVAEQAKRRMGTKNK